MLVDLAPWAAAAALVASTVLVAVAATRAWRAWRRFSAVSDAARALLDVHRARLDATAESIGRSAGVLAADGEELAELVAALRADLDHLRWLLDRIPSERAQLRQVLLDFLLPTDARHA